MVTYLFRLKEASYLSHVPVVPAGRPSSDVSDRFLRWLRPEGTDEESTQLICCLFTSRQEKDEKKQRAGEGPGRGYNKCGSLPDRTSWNPPPTLKTSATQNVERRNNFWLLPSCPHKLHVLAFRIGKDILLFGPLQQVRCKKLKLIF